MLNQYDLTVAHPEIFRMLAVKDILFVHYTCPQVDKQVNLWTHFNVITFTLNGKKTYHHGGKSWVLAYVNTLIDQYKIPLWQVMESNYMFNLTIPEYARMAQRSVSAFKREFYAHYRTTPGRWLTLRRLEHAKLLLESSRKSIGEIGYESGFENISHFSRVFKQKYGVSPMQARKTINQAVAFNQS